MDQQVWNPIFSPSGTTPGKSPSYYNELAPQSQSHISNQDPQLPLQTQHHQLFHIDGGSNHSTRQVIFNYHRRLNKTRHILFLILPLLLQTVIRCSYNIWKCMTTNKTLTSLQAILRDQCHSIIII